MADLRDFTGKNRKFTGTIGERISTGTTAERDTSFAGGTLRFNTTTNLMEYYTGTEWKSIDAPPSITFVTVDGGADTTSGQVDNEASGNVTIQVKGSLFDTTGGNVTFVGTGQTLTPATQTRNNTGLFTCVLPASSFNDANSPYTVKMTNGSGLSAELVAGLSADQTSPVFTTSAGTLGTIFDSARSSYTLSSAAATDSDGDTITYSITSGSLPPGLSLNSSTAAITGTATAVGSNTTSTFTVSAATAASTSTRQFTITVNAPQVTSYTSGSGSFTVPSGVTALSVLVIAGGGGGGGRVGGGGGAGGYVEMPSFPVTPGGTVAYSVGGGGGPGPTGTVGGDGTDSTFGTLTAIGGGGGGGDDFPSGSNLNGGSGGGTQYDGPTAGVGTQPAQPGNSGTFGFGNPGGTSRGAPHHSSGGGGGAGGAGTAGTTSTRGPGGVGKSSSISGSSVTRAGGGGGGGHPDSSVQSSGGPGGGGAGGPPGTGNGTPGTNNLGGGGGGATGPGSAIGGSGGSGVIIVSL